jgi:hypothetical protein
MVTSADCLKKYGSPLDDVATSVNENTKFEGAWMVLMEFPEFIKNSIPALPKKIYCNRDMRAPLLNALTNVVSRGLSAQIKTYDGCFNIRKMRGLGAMSLHSWGIAIDINATRNQLGKVPSMTPEFVECFTDAGFEWGGKWARMDGMHFQLAKI